MNILKYLSLKTVLLLFITLSITSISVQAQSEITFKVNLTPQLEDSIFVPDRDKIYLEGNLFPLKNSRKINLKDPAPADSIYEATVNFPPSANDKQLNYNFVIVTPEKEITEQRPRQIRITSDDRELDALYFNSFAW